MPNQIEKERTDKFDADPAFRPALHRKAKLLIRRSDFDEAIRILSTVLDASPYLQGPRIDLGYAYLYSGMLEDALHEFQSALALGAQNRKAKAGIAQVYLLQSDWRQAAEAANEVLRENSLDVAALFVLGRALRELGGLEDSFGCFDRAEQVCAEFVSAKPQQCEGSF